MVNARRSRAPGPHVHRNTARQIMDVVWPDARVKRPWQQPAHPQYANYWAPLTCKQHTMPHSAQPQHTNYWAPRTRKRHQQEHRPQRPTESSDPTQHAKGRTGDRPGPHKETTTGRNVTQGGLAKRLFGAVTAGHKFGRGCGSRARGESGWIGDWAHGRRREEGGGGGADTRHFQPCVAPQSSGQDQKWPTSGPKVLKPSFVLFYGGSET